MSRVKVKNTSGRVLSYSVLDHVGVHGSKSTQKLKCNEEVMLEQSEYNCCELVHYSKKGLVEVSGLDASSTNKYCCKKLVVNGVTKTLEQWAEETGVPLSNITARHVRGWKPEDIIRKKDDITKKKDDKKHKNEPVTHTIGEQD